MPYLKCCTIILTTFIHLTAWSQDCVYKLNLYDRLGDGWNGAQLIFDQEGMSQTFEMDSSSFQSFDVMLDADKSTELNYMSGDADDEISFELIDPNGKIIFQTDKGPENGIILSFLACPSCEISVPRFVDPRHESIRLEWDILNGDNHEVLIEYGIKDFSRGNGTFLSTRDTTILLNGLQENTSYELYLEYFCAPDDQNEQKFGPIPFQTLYSDDAGILNVIPFGSACELGPIPVGFNITNYGGLPITLIPVSYAVNGVVQFEGDLDMPQDGIYTGLLGTDSIDYFAFDNPYRFPAPGDYEFMIWTDLEEDENRRNDTSYFSVTNAPIILELPYAESFEIWSGGWHSEEIYQPEAFWQRTGARQGTQAFDGFSVWRPGTMSTDDLVVESLLSPCFDFSELDEDPIIQMALYSDQFAPNQQVLSFQYSTDEGKTWIRTRPNSSSLNWHTGSGEEAWNAPIEPGNWSLAEHVIGGLAGDTTVQFRLQYVRAARAVSDGWQMDSFSILPRKLIDLALSEPSYISEDNCSSDGFLSVRVRNLGLESVDAFDLVYEVNATNALISSYTFNLAPGQDTLLLLDLSSFESDLVSGIVQVTMQLNADSDLSNNTMIREIDFYQIYEVPVLEPFSSFESRNSWILDTGNYSVLEFLNDLALTNTLNPGDEWTIVSAPYGPLTSNNQLHLKLDWSDQNGNPVMLGGSDSIFMYLGTECFNSRDLLEIWTTDNWDATANFTEYSYDLSDYEGQVIQVELIYKNQSGLSINAGLDDFSITGCPDSIRAQAVIEYVDDQDAPNGRISIMPLNGLPGYNLEWSNGRNGNTIDSLAAGNYDLTISDDQGCMDILNFVVEECPESLDVSFQTGEDDLSTLEYEGFVEIIDIPGGLDQYEINWSNDYYNVPGIYGLSASLYSVTITDAFGCAYTEQFNTGILVSNQEQTSALLEQSHYFSVYPNPSYSDQVFVQVRKSTMEYTQVQLVDPYSGQIFFVEDFENGLSEGQILQLNNLKKGLNILFIKTISHSKAFKILKY